MGSMRLSRRAITYCCFSAAIGWRHPLFLFNSYCTWFSGHVAIQLAVVDLTTADLWQHHLLLLQQLLTCGSIN
jgi:hypothetical protein